MNLKSIIVVVSSHEIRLECLINFIFSVFRQVELASKWGGASEPPLATGLDLVWKGCLHSLQ